MQPMLTTGILLTAVLGVGVWVAELATAVAVNASAVPCAVEVSNVCELCSATWVAVSEWQWSPQSGVVDRTTPPNGRPGRYRPESRRSPMVTSRP